MYRTRPLEAYVSDAAARKPAPGGGSVSALVGALAAAMGEMSANFTVGNPKFATAEPGVRQMLEDLSARRNALLELMERDVEAYGAVDKAYSMPRRTDEEKAARKAALDKALRTAMSVPLEVMRHAAAIAAAADRLADVGNPNLITDVGVSAILADAACSAARLNVEVNLKYLRDAELQHKTDAEMETLSCQTRQFRISVLRKVEAHLKPEA